MLFILLIVNILILFINIYFYIVNNNNIIKIKMFINLNIYSKSFSKISLYLNSKYLKKNIKTPEKNIKKNISLYYINFRFSNIFHYIIVNNIIKLLKEKYFVNINPNNPDYLIYNIFGCNHLNPKYKNAIKIALYTENQLPDFNTTDYCIGHPHIQYLDRYFKMPIYFINRLLKFKRYEFEQTRKKTYYNQIKKKRFCAALITNNFITDGFRIKFINELNKYKKIDMGGKYKNNVGPIKDKITFLSSYKFSIAMENTEGDGYISEKIIDSFIAGTIPIYYGDYMIDEYINPKAFILIRGEKDMRKKIEYIKQIDNNDILYKNFFKINVINNNYINNIIIKEFIEYFEHIISQNKNKAKRVDKLFS